ncbi:MAG: MBOAT family protein, partial [Muricauda sp.]|nr:MBOAT family protein [Allomuricauda sp.]
MIGSYIFYGSWDWRFLSLIAISSLVDFYCGKRIHASDVDRQRRLYLAISLSVNLGILGIFKYCDFFISGFIDLMGVIGVQANQHTLNIILPVGISFYTFQTMSYTIDIYRRRMEPTTSLLNFSTFVAFFPQLVAGPIERAAELLPQIERKTVFNYVQFREGCFLILWGLVKKVLIADRLAVYVDAVFANPSAFSGEQCLVAVLFFAVQ